MPFSLNKSFTLISLWSYHDFHQTDVCVVLCCYVALRCVVLRLCCVVFCFVGLCCIALRCVSAVFLLCCVYFVVLSFLFFLVLCCDLLCYGYKLFLMAPLQEVQRF